MTLPASAGSSSLSMRAVQTPEYDSLVTPVEMIVCIDASSWAPDLPRALRQYVVS